ncbi:MAG: DM13 domain-containing protein [Candidatus Limnocylindria bacterium]|nr:DM13 domain-containing protein [Candidatus Limnocylindria bacterium]
MPRTRALRAAAIASAALLVTIGWYLGSPLFIRTTTNEPLPTAAESVPTAPAISPAASVGATATPARTSQTTVQRRGQLQYVDALHNGKGMVLGIVISSCCPVGDQYLLRFEDVAITNAPDVHVYLSKDRGGRWSEATSKYLGPLKATNGSFNYEIAPVDLGVYSSVVVWCRAFAVLVTWAELDPV